MPSELHILGVRHHGPGSARSLLHALERVRPDCILIEGPPDANGLISFAARAEMKPPVAILVHDVENPSNAVYYPFAEFSPEWQAMRCGLAADIPVRFMDLPQSHRMAISAERMKQAIEAMKARAAEEAQPPEAAEESPDAAPVPAPPLMDDPLGQLARAAGFDDGERWWEHVVEHRPSGDAGLFTAIREAMGELRAARDASPPPASPFDDRDEPLREAWMRQTIRAAQKEGFARIAVVCGAWHAPVLDGDAFTQKDDAKLLSGLPKIKTDATWVPWTYDRLTFASGYGAGVVSPGWYEHLWTRDQAVIESWMARTARLLREKDLDCSSAHVIEAVRLATTLASMRGRPLADLSDIADATRSVFCTDSDLPMRLIASELLVGRRLGELPEDVPMVPLAQDLARVQKRLRLKPEALDKQLELDLRNDTDRQRSHLLHRLRLLGIDWGVLDAGVSGKGTFKEGWRLRWQPEYSVRLIESAVHGTTVEEAASSKLRQLAADSSDLGVLASYLQDAMLAELGTAVGELVRRIQAVAAVAADVRLLMQTLPQLASLLRYGNVRQTDATLVGDIVHGIVPRITAGLGAAVASLNDEAAADMEQHLRATHAALELLEDAAHTTDWHAALRRIIEQESVHGLIRGRCARLLLDARALSTDDLASRLGLTLSRGNDPAQGARWLEGFLSGSGLLLIHDDKLLGLIDAWVSQIDPAIFQELVPLLRRTFATFPAPERRQIGQLLVRPGAASPSASASGDAQINPERARRVLPLLMTILGDRP